MERVQVAVPTSGEHALEVWEAIRAKALWGARGEWCEPLTVGADEALKHKAAQQARIQRRDVRSVGGRRWSLLLVVHASTPLHG